MGRIKEDEVCAVLPSDSRMLPCYGYFAVTRGSVAVSRVLCLSSASDCNLDGIAMLVTPMGVMYPTLSAGVHISDCRSTLFSPLNNAVPFQHNDRDYTQEMKKFRVLRSVVV